MSSNPKTRRDPALDAAIKCERFNRRNSGKLLRGDGVHVSLICERAYACSHDGVNQKMPARKKKIGDLPPLARTLIAFSHELGLSQEGLATRLRMKQSNVSRWEAGYSKPGLDALGRLMRLAGDNGLQDYRLCFLDEVNELLGEAQIPVEELAARKHERVRRRA